MAVHWPNWGRPTRSDLAAGLTTGLFSIPEGMAYASMAGFNPVTGLYTGMLPPVLSAFTASTVLMITTLTSAIALTSQSVLAAAGLDPHNPGNLAALAMLSGALMLGLGVLRLGVVLSFVSNAVMTGFSLGIALQMITGVLGDATGYTPSGHNQIVRLWNWVTSMSHWQAAATWVTVATVVVWILAARVPRLATQALLVAMVVVTAAVAVLSTPVSLVADIAHIPAALPGLSLPNWSALPTLAPGALAVAMVALAQAASIASAHPNPDGTRTDVDRDFRAQGLASLGGGLFHALPAGGSMDRSSIAAATGGYTRWAGVFAGCFLTLIVVACAPLAEHIPMPVIGGLIIVVSLQLIWGKVSDLQLIWRTSKLSVAALVVTFVATTQLPLQQAIVVGTLLSLLLYCVQSTRREDLTALVRNENGRWEPAPMPSELPPRRVTVINYDGTSFFAELPHLQARMPQVAGARDAVLVLALRAATDTPSSAVLKSFAHYATTLRAEGGQLVLAGVRPTLSELLEHTGIAAEFGPGSIVAATPELMQSVEHAVGLAERWIDGRSVE
ncbi:SulP family inorganic anion transporter [Nocardia tengchongensis]|uniref:SulP family inorganic anion transporter n=1 Tax=Nocardia tengchongensis TaxID=2055889 RepID=UPI0036B2A407